MTETEPTFRIDIRACSFPKLDQMQLIRKLKLMHDLGLTHFYTVIEDTIVKDTDSAKEKPNVP